jgi:hypothetical protein
MYAGCEKRDVKSGAKSAPATTPVLAARGEVVKLWSFGRRSDTTTLQYCLLFFTFYVAVRRQAQPTSRRRLSRQMSRILFLLET